MYHMAGSGIRTYETRRTFGSCWIALAFALAAMLTIGSTTPAAVIYVDGASGDDANLGTTWAQAFRTVQKALSVTDPGDEIWIAEGVYRPDEGPGMTAGDRSATFLIDGSQLGVAIYGGFEHGDTSVQDRNLDDHPTVLTGDLLGDDLPAFGLRSDNSANVVTARDVDFTAALDTLIIEAGNAKLAAMLIFDGGGIRCESASGGSLPGSPTIRHCHVRDCEARADGGGIWIGQDVSSLIFDTRISGCRAGFEGSIPSSGSGGGLRSLRSYANLVRSSVNDCTAAGPGGGASTTPAPGTRSRAARAPSRSRSECSGARGRT